MAPIKSCAAALAGALMLTGCNTVIGVGRDVQAVGSGISYVARDVNNEVFGGYGRWNEGTVTAGEPCDPAAGELRGGSGLPPC